MLLCVLYCKQIAFNKTQTDLTQAHQHPPNMILNNETIFFF